MRGDPAFEADRLDRETRYWYDRLWDAIRSEETAEAATSMAMQDDLYTYGRSLHTHILSLLTAFRVTGELALLDEVDRLAEHMRAQLRDPWRATVDGRSGTRDGFLNWVYRRDGSATHQGKDLIAFDEMRTHALVAQLAWALHNNRDLTSPNGVDYEHRARAWTAYLLEHFEAKWRHRNLVAPGAFPFLEHDSFHGTVAFVKYHHYLGKILDSDAYAREADRLSELVLRSVVAVDVHGDAALVWPGRLSEGQEDGDQLIRTTYARYVIGDMIDLHLDGAQPWSDPRLPAALAVTVREFVFDVDDGVVSFAVDVGGGESRGGLGAQDPEQFAEFTPAQYAVSGLALVTPWDATTQLATWTCNIEREQVDRHDPSVHLPAALALAFGWAYMGSRSAVTP